MAIKSTTRRILFRLTRETVILIWLQLLITSPFQAGERKTLPMTTPINLTSGEILKNSVISYRANGGFTGVKSYSVIISCAEGKISTLKTIQDPRISSDEPLRQLGTMNKEEYLNLWDQLNKMAVFKLKDGEDPTEDILDEFTLNFDAKVGTHSNSFKVAACSRPEAARFFAVKNLLDSAVNMKILWDAHTRLAKK